MQLARDKVTGRHVAIRVGHVAEIPVPVMVRTNTSKVCNLLCAKSAIRVMSCVFF